MKSYIAMNWQRIFMKLHMFTKFGMMNCSAEIFFVCYNWWKALQIAILRDISEKVYCFNTTIIEHLLVPDRYFHNLQLGANSS